MRYLFLVVFVIASSQCLFAQVNSPGERAESIKILQDYDQAADKLAFLLAQLDSANESVLLWAADQLSDYEGPAVRAALQKLQNHQQTNREIPSVASAARTSLEKISSGADLQRLSVADPVELRKIVARYALGLNEHALLTVSRFLMRESPGNPKVTVPLLAQYFPYDERASAIIVQHPEIAAPHLKVAIHSTNPFIVKGAIELIDELQIESLLPSIIHRLFMDRDDPSASQVLQSVLTVLGAFGEKPLPLLLDALYSDNHLVQMDVVGVLSRIEGARSLEILRAFENYLQARIDIAKKAQEQYGDARLLSPDNVLLEEVRRVVLEKEHTQRD